MSGRKGRVVVVGAGMGGLAAALDLARMGREVLVLDRAAAPGGKMREIAVGESRIDAGPTVFTMRWVFEELFAAAGASLTDHLRLRPISVLARHAWDGGGRLDLFADIDRSADAIGDFAGAADAQGYRSFAARARRTWEALEGPFIRGAKPTPLTLVSDAGIKGMGRLMSISPFTTLWSALGDHFRDQRLRQLFGRYATYVGSSPYLAPATLMLIAHVEQSGVWIVEGGMHRIARAIETLAIGKGARFRYGAQVSAILADGGRVRGVRLRDGEVIEADDVVMNADVSAIATGRFGAEAAKVATAVPPARRSLSAVTWVTVARTEGFPLVRHNVFFSKDYHREFEDLVTRLRLPAAPTVYVCAQDRGDEDTGFDGPDRLLCLINAPARGDDRPFSEAEVEAAAQASFGLLARTGLTVHRDPAREVVTTPSGFELLFPATGGALYGQAVHGWRASFNRPGARTRLTGLYLAGGGVHPGAGVPMATLSGRLAAAAVVRG